MIGCISILTQINVAHIYICVYIIHLFHLTLNGTKYTVYYYFCKITLGQYKRQYNANLESAVDYSFFYAFEYTVDSDV